MRSPFGAKHHVVVQYMSRQLKCPLPPPPKHPSPSPTPCAQTPCPQTPTLGPPLQKTRRTRRNQRHYWQGTSHCSCLEHCFLFLCCCANFPIERTSRCAQNTGDNKQSFCFEREEHDKEHEPQIYESAPLPETGKRRFHAQPLRKFRKKNFVYSLSSHLMLSRF